MLLFGLLLGAAISAQPTRVLFIGNSYVYSNDLPALLTQLAASLGETVITAQSTPGGHTFNLHTQNTATQALLAQGGWDFVVLQEQSQLPSFPLAQVEAECFPFAAQLVQQARAASPCAEPVFMMTWGRENGDAQNCASWPPVCTYSGMQQLLRDRYVQMAMDNQAWCAPVGAVWSAHRLQHPAVPLYTDGSHPNVTGSYIAACTLFSTLFRRSCANAAFEPAGLPPGQGALIRALASAIVADSSATWNIGASDPVAQATWTSLGAHQVLFANQTVGAAAQLWSFGDGATSTDADPLHDYGASGLYEATLVVTDDCGRMDTLTLLIDLATRIGEVPAAGHARWCPELGQLVIEGALPGAWELLQADGKRMAQGRFGPGEQRIALPRSAAGLCHWRIRWRDGTGAAGRCLAP